MPKIKVEIKWDKPKDKNWLNPYNLECALYSVCRNTKFKIKEVK